MKLEDLKDANGTSLKAYTDLILEKSKEAGLLCCILISRTEPQATFLQANVDKKQVPSALRQFANIVEGQPSGQAQIALTDAKPD